MRIRQLSYFAVTSSNLSVEELADQLGLPADEVVVAGSSSKSPRRPSENSWRLRCEEPGLTIGEQVERLINRLEPARSAIRKLTTSGNARATLQVVRYFDDDAGETEDLTPAAPGLIKLPGQHQLLGWHVDGHVVAFLADVGAEVDVDEYG